MKPITKSVAALLAVTLLAMGMCSCRRKDLTGGTASSSAVQSHQSGNYGQFTFTTTDIDGAEVSLEDYSEAKVIMFNMWEPWCGPCRQELPDLQKLYEKYKSDGLMIVGVFSDEEDLREIISGNGIKYPMIRSCTAFEKFNTGYVPTTFFTDGSGNVLCEEPYVGSQSYADWESVILSYLK